MAYQRGLQRSFHHFGFSRVLLLGVLLGFGMFQSGCSAVVSGKSTGTTSAPILTISNIAAATVTATAATFTWQTNLPATSQVEYGPTPSYGSNAPLDSAMVTSHQQSLTGLSAGTLYHYRVHSSDASNNPAVSSDLTFTTASSGGDTTPPVVSITSPGSGTTVSGSITVVANATDNVGVASVQFQLDGGNLGSLVVAGPYSTSWSTTSATNGAHRLSAIAKDSVGNTTTSTGTVITVSNITAPTITGQPGNQTVTAGQTATFTIAAGGTAPLSYQWQKNGANIAGATSASYITPATVMADSGSTFRVVVSNIAGIVTSSAATLTVTNVGTAPTITSQPANQAVTAGQTAMFTVAATGTAPLGYQWQKNGANIPGATSASYTTSATVIADSGSTFRVVVSNIAGIVTSSAATLTVTNVGTAPTITSQPANQAVTAGQTAMFTVAATGTAPLGYQWQKNGANIPGATSASYTTSATVIADSGSTFRVVVSNIAGIVTSSAATLTVTNVGTAPTITSQPANQAVTAGQTAMFTVAATGTAPLGYQWQKNGANIPGATSASYTTSATVIADSGSTFRVVVSNTAGTVTSSAATLTVTNVGTAPTITSQPANQTVTAGQMATFTVGATGTAPLGYQWQKNGANIPGATSASYTTSATVIADSGSAF